MDREHQSAPETSVATTPLRQPLRELGALFLRLGTTAFGGPAAHIAMMEDEVVRRKGWLSHAEFLDLLGLTNLIPGPNSTEMAIHIGRQRAGALGLLIAGSAFILPAALLTGTLGWAYARFGAQPRAVAMLNGIKPVMIAVVVQALLALTPKALKNRSLLAVGIVTLVLAAAGINELVCLGFAGLAAWAARKRLSPPPLLLGGSGAGAMPAALAALSGAKVALPFSLPALFLVFVKIGSVLFGSGYVLLAFLRSDLVEQRHWLTEAQLLDAIAVGQVTPGPVFTTATFIGYQLGGPWGALLATLGIFLPAFVFVAISAAFLPKIRASTALGAVLDGVNVASLALMAVVTLQLCRAALVDWLSVVLACASAVLLLRFKWNSTWLIAAGALIGIVSQGLR
ncbi:MAG TPA: chromate efflux transporter [Polyangiaceae bacterium]|nr:chromate efflux transporter [Polyangiaceae bacterium]